MMQIIKQTDEEKMAMYMKEQKKKLAEMLIQCNKVLNSTLRASENLVQAPVMLSGWQACPKCNGQGIMNKPPYIAGDQQGWMSSQMSHACDVCDGKKIISIVGGKPPASH